MKKYNLFENIGYGVVVLSLFLVGATGFLTLYKGISLLLGFDA